MTHLAIKGHPTRGSEVIALLEMLGGINHFNCTGCRDVLYYIFPVSNYIMANSLNLSSAYSTFTLEEFFEKFPYKVGDKVLAYCEGIFAQFTIQDMRWCCELNRVEYKICSSWLDVGLIQPYKEEKSEVTEEFYNKYCVSCGSQRCTRSGEWLEGCEHYKMYNELQPYKEETMDRKYNVEEYLKVWEETEKGLEVVVNDKFELKEDNGKFYIIKKQIQYPKTLEECCKTINTLPHTRNGVSGYASGKLWALQKLLICRDTYWKIAGEQMELGKPWNQDYNDRCFIIANNKGNIYTYEYHGSNNVIFAFPTEEMRDAFFENFKDLIKECKELL